MKIEKLLEQAQSGDRKAQEELFYSIALCLSAARWWKKDSGKICIRNFRSHF